MEISRAARSVLGGAYLRTIGSMMAFWLMMPLLLVTVINTDGDSHHGGADGYGGSRILLAAASPTESRSFSGRNLAMGRTGGGGGGEQVLAARDSMHESTAEGAQAWSGSYSEHAAPLHRRRSSNRRLAASTSTLRGGGGSFHEGARRGRALQTTTANWVTAHNAARTSVGVPGLSWNNTVASSADSWASTLAATCQMYHASNTGYGENLYMAWSSGAISITASGVVGAWVSEKAYYNYATNTCAAGKVCGHYTQVVWKNTKFVGCAIKSCKYGSYNAQIAVCRYSPPGNYVGQKPY
ncbi:hypothetical protein CBR_g31726 [Chara braunii]|uniref:SCP domain-containing protein n=1 Tax=Chara braunii TaxID=69332 RepID=A0A388JY21_CHABU|nr:hypothetical protein CBR_g31726 [Chara braunii]|eukprot:GBG62709.1 hypothetical protein CBR_g31726 [Chara braunii]